MSEVSVSSIQNDRIGASVTIAGGVGEMPKVVVSFFDNTSPAEWKEIYHDEVEKLTTQWAQENYRLLFPNDWTSFVLNISSADWSYQVLYVGKAVNRDLARHIVFWYLRGKKDNRFTILLPRLTSANADELYLIFSAAKLLGIDCQGSLPEALNYFGILVEKLRV